ncbi:MAG: hypothetical protein QXJ07_06415 [Candidatus Bathyarchaeia archaeon]
MSFVEKAIVDVQSGYVKYDVGGFFDGSIANNDVSADLKIQLKLGSRIIPVTVKSGFMLQMNDILLDYITCNGNFSICGVVKFKAQKLPSLFLAATGANLVSLARVGNATLTDRDWSLDLAKLQNLDVLLSSVRDSMNIAKVGGTVQTARNWSSDFAKLQNLDVALTVLARLERWGRDVIPTWVDGGEVTAPAAGTALVSKTVGTGKVGYIYGFFISAGEANDFKVNWVSGAVAKSRRIVFSGKGSLQYVDFVAFNEGLPADAGSSVTITNVNAGSAGVIYQAAILYVEV